MKILAIMLSAALLGCSTTSQVDQINAQRAAQDRECQSNGYKPGTTDYQTCIQVVAMNQVAANSAGAVATTAAATLPLVLLGAFFSDARLKEDVVRVGTLQNGLGLYRFRYLGGQQEFVGVLAQEVERVYPEAIVRGEDGYLRVHYGRIGAQLVTWEDWQGQ